MQFKLPHKSTKEQAIARIKQLLKEQEQKINENASDVKTQWNDNVLDFEFNAQGTHIKGTLTVTDTDFDLYAKLPLALRLFEGTIERMLQSEAAKLKI